MCENLSCRTGIFSAACGNPVGLQGNPTGHGRKKPLSQCSTVMHTETRRSLLKYIRCRTGTLENRFQTAASPPSGFFRVGAVKSAAGSKRSVCLLQPRRLPNGFMRVGFYHLRKAKIQHKQKAAAPPWRRLPSGRPGPPTSRRPWASDGGPGNGKRPRRQKPPGSSEVFHGISWDAQSRLLKILKITS